LKIKTPIPQQGVIKEPKGDVEEGEIFWGGGVWKGVTKNVNKKGIRAFSGVRGSRKRREPEKGGVGGKTPKKKPLCGAWGRLSRHRPGQEKKNRKKKEIHGRS